MTFRRGIRPVLGDGNCLFRALSSLTYGQEEWHSLIRRVIVEFITLNSKVFKEYCEGDIVQHINQLKHQTSWGSHVELIAAAHLLNLPIYVCTTKDGSNEHYWEIFKHRGSLDKFKFPESKLVKPAGVWHYELCHTMHCHYDIIVLEDGTIPNNPPILKHSGFVDYIEID